MRAMILAAGRGERMRPLTDTIPKPLLTIKGKPIIVHLLQALANNGITEIVINLHYLAEQMQNFLGTGKQYGVNIIYSLEEQLLDTGGGIVKALPLLGKEPFIVVSADIYSTFPFRLLPKQLTGLAHLVLVDNPPFHPLGDFALNNNKVTLSGTKKLNYGGISVFAPELFIDAPEGVFPIVQVLNSAINNNLVTGEYYAGVWHNIGTPELLQEIN